MTKHTLKIQKQFADAILCGDKRFEVRKNDRWFQRGDIVQFITVNEHGTALWNGHDLDSHTFVITYVLSGWGIEDGYVVFGIEE